jgi:hypothetical protein
MKTYKNVIKIIFLCILFLTHTFSARFTFFNKNSDSKTNLLNTKEMRFCRISFVSVDEEIFLIKQKKSEYSRKLLSVVRDAVLARLAEPWEMAHKVDIIPAGENFPGKIRTDWPATIHTIASGKMIKELYGRYSRMNIKQGEIGFRIDMLKWMAKHERLILIVAFDTIFNNHDRHRGNLFYDAKRDLFCAIDMDSSFKYNLCSFACDNLNTLLEYGNVKLKEKELKALILYKEYLQILIDKYPPEDTVKLYEYFATKAGFISGSPLCTNNIMREMEHNKRIIIHSYEDAKRLVKILEKCIKKWS